MNAKEKSIVVFELKVIRSRYDDMELAPHSEQFVTWNGWKWIRNVITDRIEELTGERA